MENNLADKTSPNTLPIFVDRKKLAKEKIKKIIKKSLSIADKILLFCFEQTGDLFFDLYYPSLSFKMGTEGARWYLENKNKKIPRPIMRLESKGLILTNKIGARIEIKLTNNGKIAALETKIALQKRKIGDGRMLLVAFDIPEQTKSTRNKLCYSLRKMGFQYIQKSVWTTDRNVIKEIESYLKILNAKKWVSLFLARKII